MGLFSCLSSERVRVTYLPPPAFTRNYEPLPTSPKTPPPRQSTPVRGARMKSKKSPIGCPRCKEEAPLRGVLKPKSNCWLSCWMSWCPCLSCCGPEWTFEVQCAGCGKTLLELDSGGGSSRDTLISV